MAREIPKARAAADALPPARAKARAIMAGVENRQRRMVQAVREACGA